MSETVRDQCKGLIKATLVGTAMLIAACTSRTMPSAIGQVASNTPLAGADLSGSPAATASTHAGHNSAAGDDKGYIDGWVDGQEVQLYYTKSYFCEEPPSSGAPSNCELGADATVAPRPGPIPTIYAIAAAGITPDPSTLACPAGSVCLNHPAMIDASRVLGPGATSIPGVPHSHILTERHAGWFHTVNIRVRDIGAWNQIAAAKNLEKVRELQADPNFGGKGLVSADTPTNIYFFIASWRQ
jgi:hypothetical protein